MWTNWTSFPLKLKFEESPKLSIKLTSTRIRADISSVNLIVYIVNGARFLFVVFINTTSTRRILFVLTDSCAGIFGNELVYVESYQKREEQKFVFTSRSCKLWILSVEVLVEFIIGGLLLSILGL